MGSLRWYNVTARAQWAWVRLWAGLGLTFFPLLNWPRGGVWFWFEGDNVIWTWPWNRVGQPWISVLMSGDGSFGDARYPTLRAIHDDWARYETALLTVTEWDPTVGDGL